jgi:hypothetical protein
VLKASAFMGSVLVAGPPRGCGSCFGDHGGDFFEAIRRPFVVGVCWGCFPEVWRFSGFLALWIVVWP